MKTLNRLDPVGAGGEAGLFASVCRVWNMFELELPGPSSGCHGWTTLQYLGISVELCLESSPKATVQFFIGPSNHLTIAGLLHSTRHLED